MKLSPRISMRGQNGNTLRTLTTVLVICLLLCALVALVPIRQIFFSYPSWRNVTFYQIVKMHLSGRPTEVNHVMRCPRYSRAGVQRSDLNIQNIKFYEDVRRKLLTSKMATWQRAFTPALEKENKISLMLTYAVFKHALDSAGLGHIVMHGSAMGAWRHQGITPWDDDMDLAISVKDWLEIKLVLSCIEGYTLEASTNSKWSFFKNDGVKVDEIKRWPFLDIFLYSEDDSYVWGLNYVHLRKFVFKKEDVFPTQTVPFECFMVPVPRHLRKVLEHQYVHPDHCVSHHTDHKTGNPLETISVPCQNLKDLYTMYYTNN